MSPPAKTIISHVPCGERPLFLSGVDSSHPRRVTVCPAPVVRPAVDPVCPYGTALSFSSAWSLQGISWCRARRTLWAGCTGFWQRLTHLSVRPPNPSSQWMGRVEVPRYPSSQYPVHLYAQWWTRVRVYPAGYPAPMPIPTAHAHPRGPAQVDPTLLTALAPHHPTLPYSPHTASGDHALGDGAVPAVAPSCWPMGAVSNPALPSVGVGGAPAAYDAALPTYTLPCRGPGLVGDSQFSAPQTAGAHMGMVSEPVPVRAAGARALSHDFLV